MLDLSHLLQLPRTELVAALRRLFPEAAAGAAGGSDWARGGRAAACVLLESIDPDRYAQTRNHVSGAVTRLSPWLRHGVLSLAEVRDAALARVRRPEEAAKLISELGWRDYWQQVYATLGVRIRAPIELPAHAPRSAARVEHVPADVLGAQTGMPCIDAFVRRLHQTGWLHNHERMWLASWLVHARGVAWQAGADWFLTHLLDGDPASNHLSWQWVAGTFSAKPYLFNRENLETFTDGVHCRPCPLRGSCDVEGSIEALSARWLSAGGPAARPPLRIRPAAPWSMTPSHAIERPLVWLTLESASDTGPAAAAHPEAPRVFALDPLWIAEERPAIQRLVFLCECLAAVPGVVVLLGDPRQTLPRWAAAHGRDGLVLAETPCPRTRAAAEAIQSAPAGQSPPAGQSAPAGQVEGMASLPVMTLPWPRFCDRSRVSDLGRFSRYWQHVSQSALQPTGTA